jgi:ABC-type transport system substrate-binding protein
VHRGYLANVTSIEAVDDATLRIDLGRPEPDFEIPLGSRNLPIYPVELADRLPGTPPPQPSPVKGEGDESGVEPGRFRYAGSGPMVAREVVPGSHVRFERNAAYWEGPVHLDAVEVVIEHDQRRRREGLVSGEFGYASQPVEDLADARALLDARPDLRVHLVPALGAQFGLALDLADPRFADVRVRHALMLAIDRQRMVDELHAGLARVLPTTPWQYLFDAEPSGDALGPWLRHDLAEARRLLEAAGVRGLAFELRYHRYHEVTNRRANELIAGWLGELGVEVTLTELDQGAFNREWFGRGFTGALDGYAPSGFTPDAYFLHSVATGGPLNLWGISDAQIDEWSERQSRELDPQARRELQRRIWDRLLDQAYRIEKVAPMLFEAYQPWLRNFRVYNATGDIGLHVAGYWLREREEE